MQIPVISGLVVAVQKRLRKRALKNELYSELLTLYVHDFFLDYLEGQSFESAYDSIEKKYIAHGLSRGEIEKVRDSIGPIGIIG